MLLSNSLKYSQTKSDGLAIHQWNEKVFKMELIASIYRCLNLIGLWILYACDKGLISPTAEQTIFSINSASVLSSRWKINVSQSVTGLLARITWLYYKLPFAILRPLVKVPVGWVERLIGERKLFKRLLRLSRVDYIREIKSLGLLMKCKG